MQQPATSLFVVLALALLPQFAQAADKREGYELTVEVAVGATEGWKLFKEGKFINEFNDGFYTDPHPDTQVYDFWSDGVVAKYSRDGDGSHETIFYVSKQEKLVYVGSTGKKKTFLHTARPFKKYKNKALKYFVRDAHKSRKRADLPERVEVEAEADAESDTEATVAEEQ